MFYQNMEIKSPQKDLCEGSSKSLEQNTDWCKTNDFRIQTLSSNNPGYLTDKMGYVVCENDSEHKLVLLKVSRWVYVAYFIFRHNAAYNMNHVIYITEKIFLKSLIYYLEQVSQDPNQLILGQKRQIPGFPHCEFLFRIRFTEISKKNVTTQSFSSPDRLMIWTKLLQKWKWKIMNIQSEFGQITKDWTKLIFGVRLVNFGWSQILFLIVSCFGPKSIGQNFDGNFLNLCSEFSLRPTVGGAQGMIQMVLRGLHSEIRLYSMVTGNWKISSRRKLATVYVLLILNLNDQWNF